MKKLTLLISLTLIFISPIYAELKDVDADIVDGVQAYELENYQFAFEELLPFAINGNNKAQYYIGLMYQEGDGVDQDISLAKEWLDKSRLTEISENEEVIDEQTRFNSGICIKLVRHQAQ